MKKLGLKSVTVKKFRPYGKSKKVDDTNKINLLDRNFKSERLREKLVGDITYIYTKEIGWTYLAIVLDLSTVKVIGFSYSKKMDSQLVVDALNNVVDINRVSNETIFHSDLGSQYTSNEFEELLKKYNITHSYSKKGCPYDNASMESFNAILKKEEVNLKIYKTFDEARLAIFTFIEGWYNNIRIHTSIGDITPNMKEKELKYIGD